MVRESLTLVCPLIYFLNLSTGFGEIEFIPSSTLTVATNIGPLGSWLKVDLPLPTALSPSRRVVFINHGDQGHTLLNSRNYTLSLAQ